MRTTRAESERRVPELDGLRGCAILMVVFWHYVEPGNIPRYVSAFGRLTWSGVDLFFVLSGFLIGGILLDARSSSNFFKTFYVRRVCRILPLYILILLAFWTGITLFSANRHPALLWLFHLPLPWYIYASLTQNFWTAAYGTLGPPFLGPTWSLAIEEQFYLVLPLIIRFVSPLRLRYLLPVVILTAPLLRTILYLSHVHGGWAAYVLMPCRADALMIGVSAALLIRSPAGWKYVVHHRRLIKAILGMLLIGMWWAGHKKWMNVTTFAMSSIGYTWVALFYVFVLLVAISQPASFVSRAFRNRVLRAVGRIAYGIYLLHVAIVAFCYAILRERAPQPADLGDFAATALACGLTLAIASISWLFFEKPLVKIGHEYTYRFGKTET